MIGGSYDESFLSKSVGNLSSSDLIGLQRSRSETSSFKYSGYLLKRSNQPYLKKTLGDTLTPILSPCSSDTGNSEPIAINYTASSNDYDSHSTPIRSGISKSFSNQNRSEEEHNGTTATSVRSGTMPLDLLNSRLQLPDMTKRDISVGRETEDTQITRTNSALDFAAKFFGQESFETTSKTSKMLSDGSVHSNNSTSVSSSGSKSIPLKLPPLLQPRKSAPITIVKTESDLKEKPSLHFSSTFDCTDNLYQEQDNNFPSRLPLHLQRMESAPNFNQKGEMYDAPPADYIDPKDHHIWRAKYCVLDDGILYFYRDARIGNSIEAKEEREHMSKRQGDDNDTEDQEAKMNFYQSIGHLAMSPMPRSPHSLMKRNQSPTSRTFESFCYDSTALWEKRVSLDQVGEVRSSQYGEKSFELLAINSENNLSVEEGKKLDTLDRLILRASSADERKNWMFELHKSFAFLVRQHISDKLVDSTTARNHVRYGKRYAKQWDQPITATRLNGIPMPGHILSPMLSPMLKPPPPIVHDLNNPGLSTPPDKILALSHGHGRSGLYRQRTIARTSEKDSSGSPRSTPGRCSSPIGIAVSRSRSQSEDLLESGRGLDESMKIGSIALMNKVRQVSQEPKSPPSRLEESAQRKMVVNEDKVNNGVSIGKYIPPHLRTQKYAPPFLRKEGLSKPVPTRLVSDVTNEVDLDLELQEQVRLEEKEFRKNSVLYLDDDVKSIGSSTKFSDDSSLVSDVPNGPPLKAGGCADPLVVEGSICDDKYIPIGASKVTEDSPEPYGFWSKTSEVGAISTRGIRETNEDSYLILNEMFEYPTVKDSDSFFATFERCALFTVFDGHVGNHPARYSAERIHHILIEESMSVSTEGERSVKQIAHDILFKSTARLDKEFCDLCVANGRDWYSGATALIVLLLDDLLVVANIGDSGGVLCSVSPSNDAEIYSGWSTLENCEEHSDFLMWKPISEKHCPSRADEKQRITDANGWVTTEDEDPIFSQVHRLNWRDNDVLQIFNRCFSERIGENEKSERDLLHIHRVCGDLAVSRAIGDREYKQAYNQDESLIQHDGNTSSGKWYSPAPMPFGTYNDENEEPHNGYFYDDLVIADPDINFFRVGNGSNEFLVLACDGLWDVMDGDEAVRMTRGLLFERGLSAKESAKRLAELAIGLGSSDNITVVVVLFEGKMTPRN